jgi:hypothetical protein
MPGEWQARQLLLIASASAPPGKLRSPFGRSTLTDCRVVPRAATDGADAAWPVSVAEADAAGALAGDHRPVPAHEELVVRREDTAIEYLERRLEQRRPGALQNHLRLLREAGRQAASVRAARQVEIDKSVGPGRQRRCHAAKRADASSGSGGALRCG